ncbi:hypothetical protein ABPG74_006177 [Tetrahymena malaccensis]
MDCKKENLINPEIQMLQLPVSFHKKTRQNLVEAMKGVAQGRSIALFRGDTTKPIQDQDIEENFQQESNIFYLFGVNEPDCHAVLELDTGKSIIVCPRIPEAYKLWMTVKEAPYFKETYQVDEVKYDDEFENYLKEKNPQEIHVYFGVDPDSGLTLPQPEQSFLQNYNIVKDKMYHILNELRVFKHQEEVDQMKFIGDVSSEAHVRVMANTKPGIREYQMEALFKFHVQERTGSKEKSYDCICASGNEGPSILHYHDNLRVVADNSLILNDMGSKYNGYCSDITVTFPSNGKFNDKQKEIYNAVYDAYISVLRSIKEGVQWQDMHHLAEQRILEHLVKLGLVIQAPIEELVQKRVGAVFMPHGLGHLIGLRVHDVGGYAPGHPEKLKDLAGLRSLRTRRTLKAGMCISVEPGCYFNKVILDQAFNNPEVSKYLNRSKIEEYACVGGVRLEDDVLITKDGHFNLTNVPRTVEEVERACAGLPWKN